MTPACKKTSNSYAFPMVAALLFAPGHSKTRFSWILWKSMKIHEISWHIMKFLIFYRNSGFAGSLGCQALQTLLFPKEYQGFVKGCGWLKTQEIIISLKSMKFLEFSWNFIEFMENSPISRGSGPAALARRNDSNSYGFSMVAARTFFPGHPKIWFFMKILVSK